MTVFGSQLARHSKVLQQSLKPGSGSPFDPDNEKDDALHYYANHTAQIEVRLTSFQRPVLSFSDRPIGERRPTCAEVGPRLLPRSYVVTAPWSRLCFPSPTSAST